MFELAMLLKHDKLLLESDQCWQGVKKYSLYVENYALTV